MTRIDGSIAHLWLGPIAFTTPPHSSTLGSSGIAVAHTVVTCERACLAGFAVKAPPFRRPDTPLIEVVPLRFAIRRNGTSRVKRHCSRRWVARWDMGDQVVVTIQVERDQDQDW